MKRKTLLIALLTASSPANAQSDLEGGLAGAFRGCEEWLLNPASWSEGTGPFTEAVGLGPKMGLVDRIDEAALPPTSLRQANHYWRINATPTAGYILVVSDRLPMCHITGGGAVDLQPTVEAVLASADFVKSWEVVGNRSKGELTSTQLRNREDPSLGIIISRARSPGQRQDRVQVIATATYQPKR